MTVEYVNIDSSIDLLNELAGAVSLATNGIVPHTREANTFAMVVKEPYGVHLGIAPWNASLFLAMRAVLTPIACGNTAVLKASELSPASHHLIARMLSEVGFPPGVLNVVQHRREDAPAVLEALISHPAVKKVNFTGSTAVGKTIAGMAARYCKPTLMELGGKACQIVMQDADLDDAARAAVVGAFLHVSISCFCFLPPHPAGGLQADLFPLKHGQICMSTDTVIAHESIAEALVEKMVALTSSWPMTSAVSEVGVSKTESLVREALSQGSSLANPVDTTSRGLTGDSLRRSKSQLHPVILMDVTREMRIYHEESFGPAVTVLTFKSEEEAVALANESIYGLSSSIFTRNIPLALRMARLIDAGAVHINSMSIHDEQQLPHGGTKSSGWGRFGVPWGEFPARFLPTASADCILTGARL